VLRWWRCTASECLHRRTRRYERKGEELTENQRRNKKEYIIRKKGRKRKETAQFSPYLNFRTLVFHYFKHNTDNCGYRKHVFSFSYTQGMASCNLATTLQSVTFDCGPVARVREQNNVWMTGDDVASVVAHSRDKKARSQCRVTPANLVL